MFVYFQTILHTASDLGMLDSKEVRWVKVQSKQKFWIMSLMKVAEMFGFPNHPRLMNSDLLISPVKVLS